jgi:hypothetical protein
VGFEVLGWQVDDVGGVGLCVVGWGLWVVVWCGCMGWLLAGWDGMIGEGGDEGVCR